MLFACTHERTRARAFILRALWGEVTRAVERESWFIMIDRVNAESNIKRRSH